MDCIYVYMLMFLCNCIIELQGLHCIIAGWLCDRAGSTMECCMLYYLCAIVRFVLCFLFYSVSATCLIFSNCSKVFLRYFYSMYISKLTCNEKNFWRN